MSNKNDSSKQFEQMVGHYLENSNRVQNKHNIYNTAPELEIRFGTNSKQTKPISKVDYLQVVSTLYSNGWKPQDDNPSGKQFLRIIPEEVVENKQFVENDEMSSTTKPIVSTDENEDKTNKEKEDNNMEFLDENSMNGGGEGYDGDKKNNKKQYKQRRTKVRSSKIRAEIFDTFWIQRYCAHNNLVKIKEEINDSMKQNKTTQTYKQLKFTEKTGIRQNEDGFFQKIHFPDFNFNVSYQMEKDYSMYAKDHRIQSIYNSWTYGKKIFRSINRVRFEHPSIPMFVDLSIVKTNRKYQNNKNDRYSTRPLPKDTIQEADVFNNPPVYEVEIELDNKAMDQYKNNLKALMKEIRQVIRVILGALQNTPYPINYNDQQKVLDDYMITMHGDEWMDTRKPRLYFTGPNSVALQVENVSSVSYDESHSALSNDVLKSVEKITSNYCVTEKADGERCILFVGPDGKVYLISRTLKVIFTGSQTKNKTCFNCIVDGEYIMYGKNRVKIFQFSAFDIYFIGGKGGHKEGNIRSWPFVSMNPTVLETRYNALKEFHQKLDLEPVTKGAKCIFQFRVKEFLYSDDGNENSIFKLTRDVWSRRNTYPYEIDGLIYTPMSYGVGGNKKGQCSEIGFNSTWNCSYKWKPPEYNTIDFLVVTEKDKQNHDMIRSYVKGRKIVQYKTVYLMVGFDTKQTRFMNPFDELIYDKLPKDIGSDKNNDHYQVKPFIPDSPYNPMTYVCYVPLVDDGKGKQMKTEEGEYFDENMIVEFKYNKDADEDHPWRWVPLRIRHDKTQSLLEGKKSMNVFKNANDVWKTIHYPISDKMITGIEPMVDSNEVVEIYYNSTVDKTQSKTHSMRDFHNLYVKSKLIIGVSEHLQKQPNQQNPLLIDYAVGKAGDLSKWIRSNLKFIMGIDYSNDNIHNKHGGACVRFLQHRTSNRNDPLRALFIEGNSKLNIRTKSEAIVKPFDKDLVQYAFGQKNIPNGEKLAFEYGVAKNGFSISSCQFAIHYFFENTITLHNFLQNLSECTQLNGYFVGTCFDGQSIFDRLKTIPKGQSYGVRADDHSIFEVEKMYNTSISELPEDHTSVGMPVKVFLESIGQHIVEYLVNFSYLTRIMENYGFELVKRDEAKKIGFPDGSGMFDLLYKLMAHEQNKSKNTGDSLFIRNALNMTKSEKKVSFLYRYFIFKKVREVSSSTMENLERKIIMEVDEEESPREARSVQDTTSATDGVATTEDADDAEYAAEYADDMDAKKDEPKKERKMKKIKNKKIVLD